MSDGLMALGNRPMLLLLTPASSGHRLDAVRLPATAPPQPRRPPPGGKGQNIGSIRPDARRYLVSEPVRFFLPSFNAACAAASLAIGTR